MVGLLVLFHFFEGLLVGKSPINVPIVVFGLFETTSFKGGEQAFECDLAVDFVAELNPGDFDEALSLSLAAKSLN